MSRKRVSSSNISNNFVHRIFVSPFKRVTRRIIYSMSFYEKLNWLEFVYGLEKFQSKGVGIL